MFPDAWQRLLKEIVFSEVSKELEEFPITGHTHDLLLSRLFQAAYICPVTHQWTNHYWTAVWMTNYNPAKCAIIWFPKSNWFPPYQVEISTFRMQFPHTNMCIAMLSTWLLPIFAMLQSAASLGDMRNSWKMPSCSCNCEENVAGQVSLPSPSKHSQTAFPSGLLTPVCMPVFWHWKCYVHVPVSLLQNLISEHLVKFPALPIARREWWARSCPHRHIWHSVSNLKQGTSKQRRSFFPSDEWESTPTSFLWQETTCK